MKIILNYLIVLTLFLVKIGIACFIVGVIFDYLEVTDDPVKFAFQFIIAFVAFYGFVHRLSRVGKKKSKGSTVADGVDGEDQDFLLYAFNLIAKPLNRIIGTRCIEWFLLIIAILIGY